MADIIQSTIHKVLGDGARATKFKCYIQLPAPFTAIQAEDLDTIIKSTKFPERETETITISYKGKDIVLPGQEKYEQTIDITFYLQEDHDARKIFDIWAEAMHYDRYNPKSLSQVEIMSRDLNALKTSITLTQMDFHNKEDRISYRFYYTFPTKVSGPEVNSESVDTIEEFTVTFAYTYYEIVHQDHISQYGNLDYLPFDMNKNYNIDLMHSQQTYAEHEYSFYPYKETEKNWIGE